MNPVLAAMTPPPTQQNRTPMATAADTAQLTLLSAIAKTLYDMKLLLEQIAKNGQPVAPNYRFPLASYPTFDWPAIGAVVLTSDDEGATTVSWNDYTWKRRSGGGKFGNAIWFSRPNGKDDSDKTEYIRLVTFKDESDAEELDGKVAKGLTLAPTTTAAPQQTRQRVTERPSAIILPREKNNLPSAETVSASEEGNLPSAEEEKLRLERIVTLEKITSPEKFDALFLQLHPEWREARYVHDIREAIGKLGIEILPDAMRLALKAYYSKRVELTSTGVDKKVAHAAALKEARAIGLSETGDVRSKDLW